jgi:hypothetical protein
MRAILIGCCLAICTVGSSQVKQRKLGPALNSSSFNYWAPYVSIDGNTLLFNHDYTDDNTPALFVAIRQGVDWNEPVLIPKKITALSFSKGSTLSPDGKSMYITSSRGGTLGGFDILVSQITGTAFSDPQSIGAPINSTTNEGSPTFSPDGTIMYFMRCNKMNFAGADECKIMTSRMRNGQWEMPAELPSTINAGNSQMPRMLADGQTLLFSSNKHTPSKGGMDLYMTRLNDNQWSAPVNLDFVNTSADEIYASASSLGLYLLKDMKGERKSELVEYLFPNEVKPKAVVRVLGVIEGLSDPAKGNINLVNLETKKTLYNLRPDSKGNFVCYIPEGYLYGLYVDPPTENFRFFAKRYDLRKGNKIPNSDRIMASLKPLGPGDEMEMTGVLFKSFSSEIDPLSVVDFQKTARMLRGNPSLNFSVDVTLFGLMKDAVQREDLTEVVSDTVVYEKEFQVDSVTTETRDSIVVEYLYHNDRTQKQAQSIAEMLVKHGAPANKITITYKALEEPVADKRRTVVKIKAH